MDVEELRAAEDPERERIDLAEISNAMVRLYKEMFGRGPSKARSDLAGPDILVSTLENTLTTAERNMVKAGEHQRLRDVRLYFQYASKEQFVSTIEEITGRKVRAFISGMDTEQDVATEVFYFEPVGMSPGTHDDQSKDELTP